MMDAGSISGVRGVGPMAKAMSIAGLVVGGLLALIFAADLILGIPFGGKGSLLSSGSLMDLGFLICALILCYLSWNALRDAT
jgi:hypothetical protein